jgi:hypothetical protein
LKHKTTDFVNIDECLTAILIKKINGYLRLAEYHDDFCTLRREIVVEGLMKIENSVYWLVS